ncbi:hypothetical protein KUTeg_006296 [Tegillarca granosa]|uniref:Uncharacterized protein n=1 Tax=Tegillarca granosa TaxID=220873 RepID=A0ABQ9FG26_TEGGR|nr:hypothetical protein KUTeg_006296 [Tegillarca granosa]
MSAPYIVKNLILAFWLSPLSDLIISLYKVVFHWLFSSMCYKCYIITSFQKQLELKSFCCVLKVKIKNDFNNSTVVVYDFVYLFVTAECMGSNKLLWYFMLMWEQKH